MKILIIDTTRELLFVGLQNDGQRSVYSSKLKSFHNKIIMNAIDDLLVKANLRISDLSYIAVVSGPGSFTGIRIGISIANALSYASGVQLVNLNSLELIANKSGEYITAIHALAQNYYYATMKDSSILETSNDELDNIKKLELEIFIRDNDEINEELYFERAIAKAKTMTKEDNNYIEPNYMKVSQAERLRSEAQAKIKS